MPAEEEVHARHILVATEDEAKALIAEIKKGAAFDKLAKEKSTDKASGAEGGDLGWFKKTDMVKEFADAAFDLKKGELTETPVKTQFGYHVIKVEDRRKAPPPAFEEMADQLREEMAREAVTAQLDQLRSGAKIEKFNIDGSKPDPARRPSRPRRRRRPTARPPPRPAPQRRQVKLTFLCVSGVGSALRSDRALPGQPQGEFDGRQALPYRRSRLKRRRRCRASRASSSPRRSRACATRTATTSCWRWCRPAPPSRAC